MKSLKLSIVSHGQGDIVRELLDDLSGLDLSAFASTEVFVTLNIPEDEAFLRSSRLPLNIIRNVRPIGFGANHNQAFSYSPCDFFTILNPDIRLKKDFLFSELCDLMGSNAGVVGPLVLDPLNRIEDSARRYPTLVRIAIRVIFKHRVPDYSFQENATVSVDWMAGMVLVFDSIAYKLINGFDDRFFMYLEDVDICRRLNRLGCPVIQCTSQSVIHDARRSSLKSISHMKWHLRSLLRFLFKF